MSYIINLIRETDFLTWFIISGSFVIAVHILTEIFISLEDEFPD